MFCCPNCFSDNFLQRHITTYSKKKGCCSFCKTKTISPLLKPSHLVDLFQPILDLYSANQNGKLLNELLQIDWLVFSTKIEGNKQLKLLSVIAGDVNILKKRFSPTYVSDTEHIKIWDDFSNELKHENRFFPKNVLKIPQLSELFTYLIMGKEILPKYIYRARVNRLSTKFTINEMGKPPVEKSLDGRANPKGISYFYGANDEKTTIAETRPYKTDVVNVAKFKISLKDKKIIDIREPKKTISPFGLDDDAVVLLYTKHIPFFIHLRDQLSIPVLPHKKDFEYLSTQYICELIKDSGFSGIAFKSSLEKGDNYVFFDDSFLRCVKITAYKVSDITIQFGKVRQSK